MITDQRGLAAYCKRLMLWQQKALREAKLHSDWAEPNRAYEAAASDFIAWLFSGSSELLPEIAGFVQCIHAAGAAKSLAQTLLKLTAPGVPDFYQGAEYWDFSLVDPDNRTPVDFTARQASLEAMPLRPPTSLDSRLKQFLIVRVLAARKKTAQLFSAGRYIPLEIAGPSTDNFVAFARVLHDYAAITLFCRLTAQLFGSSDFLSISTLCRRGTRLLVPPDLQGSFADALLADESVPFGPEVDVGQILRRLPVALLIKAPT